MFEGCGLSHSYYKMLTKDPARLSLVNDLMTSHLHFTVITILTKPCCERYSHITVALNLNFSRSLSPQSPEGVKRNACSTLSAWTGAREPVPVARFLVSLALFHALAQERRAYIPQGETTCS